MNATMTNGRGRKSLASQLDRLDAILDGLADGLNEAVVTAVREAVAVAVQEAVRAVLTEILANPDVLARLRGAEQPARKSIAARVTECAGRATSWLSSRLRQVGHVFCAVRDRVQNTSAAFRGQIQVLKPFWLPILIALGVGLMAGVAAYFAGPWLSVVTSGIGGFATTLAVQAGLWLRRVLGTAFSDA